MPHRSYPVNCVNLFYRVQYTQVTAVLNRNTIFHWYLQHQGVNQYKIVHLITFMQSELRKENLWGPVVLDSVVVTCINYLFFFTNLVPETFK